MMFEYAGSLYVSEKDIEKMLSYCKHGYSYEQAIRVVAFGWSGKRYYNLDDILSQLILELERRMEVERG